MTLAVRQWRVFCGSDTHDKCGASKTNCQSPATAWYLLCSVVCVSDSNTVHDTLDLLQNSSYRQKI